MSPDQDRRGHRRPQPRPAGDFAERAARQRAAVDAGRAMGPQCGRHYPAVKLDLKPGRYFIADQAVGPYDRDGARLVSVLT